MSLRIVWGEGSFDIEQSDFKIMAWMTYILIILVGNIVFMNFLIAVVNQSYESCMQRMQSHSQKSKLLMIRDHYLTLTDEDFKNEELFPLFYIHPKISESSSTGQGQQEWQGMVKELKLHSEKLISDANIEMKKNIMKL